MTKTLTFIYEFEIPDDIDLNDCENNWIEGDDLYIKMPGAKEPIKIEGCVSEGIEGEKNDD